MKLEVGELGDDFVHLAEVFAKYFWRQKQQYTTDSHAVNSEFA